MDPQARHTRKSQSNRKDGYRAHLVAEPGTGLVTDEALTMAAGAENSDAAVAARFLADTIQAPDQQVEHEQAEQLTPAEQAEQPIPAGQQPIPAEQAEQPIPAGQAIPAEQVEQVEQVGTTSDGRPPVPATLGPCPVRPTPARRARCARQ